MAKASVLPLLESEERELKVIEEVLAKTPRLARLLSFLIHHYSEGTTHLLTEFNIATQVFGRAPETFIASEDAIARVETHRLRKKLKQFYQTDGRLHTVQISIPLGTYVPIFVHPEGKTLSERPRESVEVLVDSPGELKTDLEPPPLGEEAVPITAFPQSLVGDASRSAGLRPRWFYGVGAGILVCVLLVYAAIRMHGARPSLRMGSAAGSAVIAASGRSARGVPPTAGVEIPFRMIAGYSGPGQKDPEGNLWQEDQYYRSGWPVHHPAGFIPGTNDPSIFQYGREGDFDYTIPVKPGNYELHLYFLQRSETAQGEEAENKAVFDVAVNGKVLLNEFDIVSDAMGRNIADERVFRDVSPAQDGFLHLHVSTVVGTPSLDGIALLEGTPGKQLPVRIITQPIPLIDSNGQVWQPDNYFIGGRYLSHNLPTVGSDGLTTASSERYGHFTYAIPVDPRDEYSVTLYFAELFFGSPESSGGGSGSRVFRVMCNGNTLLDHFDIFKEAGSFHVLQKTFHHLRPTAQGKLNLTFEPIVNYATVSAIEVLDESR